MIWQIQKLHDKYGKTTLLHPAFSASTRIAARQERLQHVPSRLD